MKDAMKTGLEEASSIAKEGKIVVGEPVVSNSNENQPNSQIEIGSTSTIGTPKVTNTSSVEGPSAEDLKDASGGGVVSDGSQSSSNNEHKLERELKLLTFDNPGRGIILPAYYCMENRRSKRQVKQKNYAEVENRGDHDHVTKPAPHDEKGRLSNGEKDVCDCLVPDCPGCHYPCPQCQSRKCGHECRCGRNSTFSFVQVEGKGGKRYRNMYE